MKTRTPPLSFALAAVSFASGITGKWSATIPGRKAGQTTTVSFKQDSVKLTGHISAPQGDRPIPEEGKVAGESQRGKQTYSGAVSGGEIKFKREGGQAQPREFAAERAR